MLPVDAMVALVVTFDEGIMLERRSGVMAGDEELLPTMDHRLHSLERQGAGDRPPT